MIEKICEVCCIKTAFKDGKCTRCEKNKKRKATIVTLGILEYLTK